MWLPHMWCHLSGGHASLCAGTVSVICAQATGNYSLNHYMIDEVQKLCSHELKIQVYTLLSLIYCGICYMYFDITIFNQHKSAVDHFQ
jgi:hypothetical protein